MPPLNSLEGVLWLLSVLLTVSAALSLYLRGLASGYRWFVAFLLFAIARALVAPFIPPRRSAYGYYFMYTEGVALFLYMLVTLELFSRLLEQYRGIYSLSRWVLTGAMVVSVGIALVSLTPDMSRLDAASDLAIFFVIERGVLSALVVLTLLELLFLWWFPVRMPRNVAAHAFLFSAYFLTKAFLFFVRNLWGPEIVHPVSTAILTISCLCMLLWTLLLKRSGEQREVLVGRPWDREEEDRLVGQLRSINRALSSGSGD